MYLRVNGIGANLALFYEAWAMVLENKGKMKEADEIFTEGITKYVRVSPTERPHNSVSLRAAGDSGPIACRRHPP